LACYAGWRYRFARLQHKNSRGDALMPKTAAAALATLCGAAVLLAALAVAPAAAQSGGEVYKGKQIKFVVGTAAGQDYDPMAGRAKDWWRALGGCNTPRHIPGNPTLFVENMPGAGHIVATNHLFNVAARDGTVIGMVSRNMTDAAVMGLANVRYDPGRFNWL